MAAKKYRNGDVCLPPQESHSARKNVAPEGAPIRKHPLPAKKSSNKKSS